MEGKWFNPLIGFHLQHILIILTLCLGFVDSAASLAISAQTVLSNKYDIELVVIVQPVPWLRMFHAKLRKFGYRVVEAEIPAVWATIPRASYKGAVNSSGCCGMNELVKLNALMLTE